MRATIRQRRSLRELPSCSALERVGAFWYIIGDDARELYRLDDAFQLVGTTQLVDIELEDGGRIAKASKPDLEAMTRVAWQGRHELLLLGSGSKSPERDHCFRVDVSRADAPVLLGAVSLTPLYDTLRANAQIVGTQKLNLEAAAATDRRLFLFQRGNLSGVNAIAEFDTETFLRWLDAPTMPTPLPRVARVELPALEKCRAGFSGAVFLNQREILFAASVEDTPDEIQDGPTIGSFIGLLELGEPLALRWVCPVEADGEIARVKIEGLDLFGESRDPFKIAAVTDDDAGESEVLEIEIE